MRNWCSRTPPSALEAASKTVAGNQQLVEQARAQLQEEAIRYCYQEDSGKKGAAGLSGGLPHHAGALRAGQGEPGHAVLCLRGAGHEHGALAAQPRRFLGLAVPIQRRTAAGTLSAGGVGG